MTTPTPRSGSPDTRVQPAYARLRAQRLFVPWLLVWATCTWLMWVRPETEVIPYHLVWIAFAMVYGFEPWPLRQTLVTLGVTTAVTGSVMVVHAYDGALAPEELAEVPLMLALCLLVAWHVQRRDAATRRAAVLAHREVEAAVRRERLARLTSHEMRTPLTIATGYVDLLLEGADQGAGEEGPGDGAGDGAGGGSRRADLLVVRDELGRLARTAERLVRMIRLQDVLPAAPVDLDRMLEATAGRFAALADRTWVVESDVGVVQGSAEQLRACLDTLIENALRYTGPSDIVRLIAFRDGDRFWIGVADSGPGLDPGLVRDLNGGRWGSPHTDELSQTGLGLELVRDIVEARHGRLFAGRSSEGGALLLARLPVVSPATLPPARPPDPLPVRGSHADPLREASAGL